MNSPQVVADARIYLQVTCGGVIFSFLNQIFTGIMTAMGNSRISFMATAVGLLINIVLDPLLIFGAGPIPKMGAARSGCGYGSCPDSCDSNVSVGSIS